MRELIPQELAEFDGRDGRPAYVAFAGKVYDVTGSPLWRGGRHQALHQAGQDLIEAAKGAPHGPELLARFRWWGCSKERRAGCAR